MISILKLLLLSTFFSVTHGATTSVDEHAHDRMAFGCLTLPKELTSGYPALVDFIKTLPLSSKAVELIQDIQLMHGQIYLVLADNLPTNAHWQNEKKTISISRNLLSKQFEFGESLLFEMCNAANQTLSIPPRISIDAESYALFTESCEYLSSRRRTEIMVDYLTKIRGTAIESAIIQMSNSKSIPSLSLANGGWTDHSNKWDETACSETIIDSLCTFKSFESWWENNNRKCYNTLTVSHSDLYRDQFRQQEASFLAHRYDPHKDEWDVVCSAISAVSFMRQKTATKLLVIKQTEEE